MRLSLAALLLAAPGAALAQSPSPTVPVSDAYYIDGQQTLAAHRAVKPNKKRAKNVILFIGDGMDPTTVAAARIYDGQSRGQAGEENYLSFERFPYLAHSKTYNTNSQVPDSAGTASAMVTGAKTKAGVISVTDDAAFNNCASSAGHAAMTLAELSELSGMATGVVTTARLTHATPATAYAHTPHRNWESDADLSDEARANDCKDIASQLIDFPFGDGVDLAFGGGRGNFIGAGTADPEDATFKGRRKDGRDLTAEWTKKSAAHAYVWNRQQFDAIDPAKNPRVLGLFESSHMQFEADRARDKAGEPSLAEMTAKAIDILSRDRDGYFLMIEGGRIDHAHHGGNAARALIDTQAYAAAVAKAREMTSENDTLIVVTADHGHTMAFQGYPARGNPILGLANSAPGGEGASGDGPALAGDGRPYTTLVYANGPGSVLMSALPKDGKRPAPAAEETAGLDYLQQALIPMGYETHGGQDVAIYASGPRAYLFGGTVEQSYIFHVIADALNLQKRAGVSK